jgi:hypothetical protein
LGGRLIQVRIIPGRLAGFGSVPVRFHSVVNRAAGTTDFPGRLIHR